MTVPKGTASLAAGAATPVGRSRRLPRVGTDTIFSLADQIVISAMGFGLTVQIGRSGRPSDLGTYALAMSVAWLIAEAFTALVLCPVTMRLHERHPAGRGVLRAVTLAQGIAAAVLAAAGYIVAFGGLVGPGGDDAVPAATLVMMALAVGALVLREQARRLRTAELDVAGALGLDLRAAALLVIGGGALAASGAFSLAAMMAVVVVAFGGPSLAWCAAQLRRNPVSAAMIAAASAESWRAGRMIFLSGVVWAAVTYAYPWLLARQHGLAASGSWAAAMSLVAIAGVPIAGIQNYSGVRILAAARHSDRLTREILGWSGLSVGICGLVAGVFWLCGDSLVRAVFGTHYLASGPLALLLVANLAAMCASFPFSRGLFALHAARYDAVINLLALALLLPGGYLSAEYGVAGAGWALTITSAVCFLARVGAFFLVAGTRRIEQPPASGTCGQRA